jgi:DNA-binding NarL/FixJ family response regulator
MIKTIIVDDHAMVRQGLRVLLEKRGLGIDIVGEAANGYQAVALARKLLPDVVVMDLTLPGMDGLEAAAAMRELGLASRVLVVSMHRDPDSVAAAFAQGACGYVLKESAGDSLVEGIRAVHRGQRYLGPGLELPAAERPLPPPADPAPPLTGATA